MVLKQPKHKLLLWLYLANATVLILQEIDAAYWHEWELLGLPGDEAGFLLLHIPLLLVVLIGLLHVDRGALARPFALLLALLGLLAFAIHTFYFAQGEEAFTTPVSLSILGGTLLLSLGMLWIVWRYPR